MHNQNYKKEIVSFIRRNPLQVLGTMWIGFLVAAFAAVGLFLSHSGKSPVSAASLFGSDSAATAAPDTVNTSGARVSYADVVDRVAPSVVTVRSEMKVTAQNMPEMPLMNDPRFREFFGNRLPQNKQQPKTEHALGSGVIISGDGTILTNNHVVENAQKIKVELPDRRSFDARVIGSDKLSDLAVLKVEGSNLPVLPLGDSDKVRVGDVVLAVGYPLGLRQTVTSGIISAKGRSTGVSDGSFEDFLQTDAPINHGNSGGALVNMNGELVGINSQMLSPSGGSIGIGFAIPSNMARGVMQQLVQNGKVRRGQLGVGIQNVTSELAQQLGLKDVSGAIVNLVKLGSPADRAGLKQYDVILAVNGANVADNNELRNRIAQSAPGTEVTLTILRDGKEQTVRATLNEMSAEKAANDNNDNNDDNGGNAAPDSSATGKLGLALQTLTPEIAAQLNLKNASGGLVVADVQEGSAADEAGIAQGDVIQQINRQPVKTMADVKAALARTTGKSALMLVNRQGQTLFVTVQQ